MFSILLINRKFEYCFLLLKLNDYTEWNKRAGED